MYYNNLAFPSLRQLLRLHSKHCFTCTFTKL